MGDKGGEEVKRIPRKKKKAIRTALRKWSKSKDVIVLPPGRWEMSTIIKL